MSIQTNICITNDLARAVGKIADERPDRSIEIVWDDQLSEQEWLVNASDGTRTDSYLVDDESGAYVRAGEDVLRLIYPEGSTA